MAGSARQTIVLFLLTIIAVVAPIMIARSLLEQSREAAVTGDRVNYLSHRATPETLDDTRALLDDLLAQDLRTATEVPRIFLARLPGSLPEIHQSNERKRLFISAVLPVILRANELLTEDRRIVKLLRDKLAAGQRIRNSEKAWLRRKEKLYRLPPNLPRTLGHLNKLLLHIDIIPPSLALTQAAIESGWGTSRFAQKGNALFGEWLWGDGKGIVPQGRDAGKTHRIKAFDYLLDSVMSYMINLNRNPRYSDLRDTRAYLRSAGQPITGDALIYSLSAYSERGDAYLADVSQVMLYNRFDAFDILKLAAN